MHGFPRFLQQNELFNVTISKFLKCCGIRQSSAGLWGGTATQMSALLRFTAREPGATLPGADRFLPLHSSGAATFLTRA